jgi:hypothetical protein
MFITCPIEQVHPVMKQLSESTIMAEVHVEAEVMAANNHVRNQSLAPAKLVELRLT